MEEKKGRLVFNMHIAKCLLEQGYTIIGLKRNKYNPEKSVFVFELVDGFDDDLHERKGIKLR